VYPPQANLVKAPPKIETRQHINTR
jgi:hypothetical protein